MHCLGLMAERKERHKLFRNFSKSSLEDIVQELNYDESISQISFACNNEIIRENFGELCKVLSRKQTWEAISFHSCTELNDQKLVEFSFLLRFIHSLDLSSCKLISDYGINAICHSRMSLTLTSIKCTTSHFTNKSLINLSQECKNLTELHITGCPKITDDGVIKAITIKKENNFPFFKVIMMGSCKKLTNQSILHIGTVQGEYLEKINLSFCFRVTDKAIIFLAEHTPNLQLINLCGCKFIGDEAVVALLSSCPNLTKICLNSCKRITNTTLQFIFDFFAENQDNPPPLEYLDIRECDFTIDFELLNNLRKIAPSLIIIAGKKYKIKPSFELYLFSDLSTVTLTRMENHLAIKIKNGLVGATFQVEIQAGLKVRLDILLYRIL